MSTKQFSASLKVKRSNETTNNILSNGLYVIIMYR